MSAFPDDKRAQLTQLLDSESALLSEYERQTELQSRLLTEGELDGLNASLDRRQGIIERLDRLHQETEVLMQSYMSAAQKDGEIDRRLAERTDTIKALLKRDGEIHAAIKAVSAEYAKEIRGLSENRRGLDGYKLSDTGHSGIFDKSM